MNVLELRRVTVIAEAVLEPYLVADLRRLGAKGYTVCSARGEGTRGQRRGELEGGNIRLEVVVQEAVAGVILEHLSATYFEHYALIAYIDTVSVVRGEKYI